MNEFVEYVTNDMTVINAIKLIVLFAIIAHIVGILIIQKQIHQADRVGSAFTHKLLELGGYINIFLLAIIFLILLLPI